MNQPVLHTRTKRALQNYLHKPTHGLILSGQEGSGKYHVAQWLAAELNTPTFTIKSPEDKSSIAIEQIRELYNITRTGSGLVIIIKDAHQLGREAQNAFLKLLEEPPKNTRFILTSENETSLLSTIRSRSQSIEVLPPSGTDLLQLVSEHASTSPAELQSLLHTSKGLAGSFIQLLNDHDSKEKHQACVQVAKSFYTATIYERHIICIESKFEKLWISELLNLLATIIQSLLKRSAGSPEQLKRLTAQANLIETTAQNILKINGNPKVHLAILCEQL